MSRSIRVELATALLVLSVPAVALAQNPVQLALWDPMQIVKNTEPVDGVRLSLLYTENTDVTGVDLGSMNVTTGSSVGLQLTFYAEVHGNFTGVQWGVFNRVNGNVAGWQASLFANGAAEMSGLQLGLLNVAQTQYGAQVGLANVGWLPGGQACLFGLQLGLLNGTETPNGVQCGVLNGASHLCGLQLGLLNWCKTALGIQIGLINIMPEGGILPVFPIFNFSF